MKFSIKDFFSKCDQIRRKLRNGSHLLKKSFMENFIFCAVNTVKQQAIQLHVYKAPISSFRSIAVSFWRNVI